MKELVIWMHFYKKYRITNWNLVSLIYINIMKIKIIKMNKIIINNNMNKIIIIKIITIKDMIKLKIWKKYHLKSKLINLSNDKIKLIL